MTTRFTNRAAAAAAAVCAFLSLTSTHAATLHVPKDHATIQKAIDAAKADDIVLVEPGTYRERVTMKAGVTLRSAGDDAKGELGLKRAEVTIIDGGGALPDGAAGATAPGVMMAEDAVLDGFTVTNVGAYDDASWKHHHATQGNEQKHEHIGHFGTPGVGVQGVDCTLINNIVHHNGSTGIAIRGEEGKPCSPLVARNVTYRNMGGGIGSMAHSTATIEDNICFQNFYAGIGHDNASPIVRRNVCYENVRAGIGISEGACPVVTQNRCYRNRRAGIGTRTGAATRPTIADNDCYENDMAGIGTDEEAEPIIRGNRCYRNALAGIGAQHGAAPIITGNECYENKAAGIGCRDGARATIIGNISRNNASAGIGVESDASALIMHNKCVDNGLVAIGVPSGGSAIIIGNELSRKGGQPPLVALRGGAKVTFNNNTVRGGGVAGVLVEGDVKLSGNRFEAEHEKQGTAVWVWKTSTVDVAGNQFDGYRNAVNASGSSVSASRNQVRNFGDAAIVVRASTQPAVVVDNIAESANPKAKAADVDGDQSSVTRNFVKAPPQAAEANAARDAKVE